MDVEIESLFLKQAVSIPVTIMKFDDNITALYLLHLHATLSPKGSELLTSSHAVSHWLNCLSCSGRLITLVARATHLHAT